MKHDPPGPRDRLFGLTFLGRFRRQPLQFLSELARTYGDIVYLRLGPFRTYLVNHPDHIREVLVAKSKTFVRLERQKRVFRKIDGNGLVSSEGDFWLRQRRLVQPAFAARRMERYAQVAVALTRRRLDAWPTETVIDLDFEMTQLTLEIIAKTLFDLDLTGAAAQLAEATEILRDDFMREFMAVVPLPDWLPLPHKRRMRRAIGVLDNLVRDAIRHRRSSGEDRGDLLSMLLLAVDEQGSGGMTDEQARDEAMTLFNGGHDSTSAALTWISHLLASHPAVQSRLVDEVTGVLGDRAAAYADLPQLVYTQQVIKEALRLYPPTTTLFIREAIADTELAGYPIRKGSWIYLSPYVTQRDPRWYPDPERFDPDRFAPGHAEHRPEYAYFPFGAGPHVCIGMTFALMEMAMIVATMMQHFQLKAAGPQPVEPAIRVALRPIGGLPLTVTRRPARALTVSAPS
jgi:cytochrome P450